METKEKLVNLRPIVLSACALACGIYCAYNSFFHGKIISLIAFVLIALSFLVLCFLKLQTKKKALIYLLLVLLFFSLGHFLTDYKIEKSQNQPYNQITSTFSGRIYQINSYESGVLVQFDNCKFNGEELNGKTEAFIFNDQMQGKMDIGAIVECRAKIVNRGQDQNFNATTFSGVYYSLEDLSNISIIGFKANFYEIIYLNVRSFIKENLSPEGYQIALALTLGDDSYFAKDVLENYRFAGIAHVFAVSGLHIGAMVSLFTFIAKKSKAKRKVAPFIILIPAFIYCGICGFRPSSLRAFIMAATTVLANYFGFKRDNLSATAIAGIILLIINPFNLFDYGFKLSFVAVSSIFALAPLLKRGAKLAPVLGEPLSISLSAQLGTLPILTQMSGYTSIISILTNLLLVPVSVFLYGVTLISVALCALLSLITESALVIFKFTDLVLTAVNGFLSRVDFSYFALPLSFGGLSVIWYIGLACLSDYLNLTKKQKIAISVLTLLVVFGGTWLNSLINLK